MFHAARAAGGDPLSPFVILRFFVIPRSFDGAGVPFHAACAATTAAAAAALTPRTPSPAAFAAALADAMAAFSTASKVFAVP